MEATFVEFYIDDISSFHVSLKLKSTTRSNTPYPINHEQPKCYIMTKYDQIGFCFVSNLGKNKAYQFKWAVVTNPWMNSFKSFGKSKGKR